MDNSHDETQTKRTPRRLSIGSTFFVVYGLAVAMMIVTSMLAEPTTDFSGRTAREFSIALIPRQAGEPARKFGYTSLEQLDSIDAVAMGYTFLLPEPKITIDVGDVHRAEVLEEHGDSQLVSFQYSNTRTSVSVYRAYAERIEPVSYKLTSSVGQVFSAFILIFPALVVAAIITGAYNRFARS